MSIPPRLSAVSPLLISMVVCHFATCAAADPAVPRYLHPLATAKCADSAVQVAVAPTTAALQAGPNDGAWSPVGIPGRINAQAFYDPTGDRMLVLDGSDAAGLVDGLLSLPLDGPLHWGEVSTVGNRPPADGLLGSVFDQGHHREIVCGYTGEVWTLSLAGTPAWTQLGVTGGGPQAGATLIYDSRRDRLVSFGGGLGLDYVSDVWSIGIGDTSPTWVKLTPVGLPPTGRSGAAVVYDSTSDRMVVFGGVDCTPTANDTWTLMFGDSDTWAPLPLSGVGPSGTGPCVFDAARRRMLVVLGTNGSEGWALDLASDAGWSRVDVPASGPGTPAFYSSALVFDSARDRLIDYGGVGAPGPSSAVWELPLATPSSWHELTQSLPAPRDMHAAIRDPVRDRMIVFGGNDTQYVTHYFNDVWAWPLSGDQEWQPIVAAGTPPPPMATMTTMFDPVGDRMILYGEDTDSRVWSLTLGDTPAWTELTPSGVKPAGRYGNGAIYDPLRHRMLIFGGALSAPTVIDENDVWALSLDGAPAWTQILPAGAPPSPRSFPLCVYDPAEDRMVTIGSESSGAGTIEDVWALGLGSVPAWTQLTPTGGPPPTIYFGAAIYDSVVQRIVVANDTDSNLWALSLQGSPTWQGVAPTGTAPGPRILPTLIYDPRRDRMIEFGGLAGGTYLNDTWALTWNRQSTPTMLSLADYDAGPDHVTLRWQASDAAEIRATVERSTDGATWRALGTPRLEGPDLLVYDDLGMSTGRWLYRLDYVEAGGQRFSDPVVVQVPAVEELALGGFQPNPATSNSAISFSLPDARPARLELLDVRGRILLTREVGGLGAGTHNVRLSEAGRLGAGVYWVRLVRTRTTLTRKGVVAG